MVRLHWHIVPSYYGDATIMKLKQWLMAQAIRIRRVATHTIHPDYIRAGAVVLDLGANHGEFSRAMADKYGAVCYMIEANPQLAEELAASQRQIRCAAVVGKSRGVQLCVREDDQTSGIVNVPVAERGASVITVEGLDYAAVLRTFGLTDVDLVKIDIEGAEIEAIDAITDEQLQAIGQMTIEFHDEFGYYSCDQSRRIIARLNRLGFVDLRPEPASTVDVLLVNRYQCPGARGEWLRVLLLTRPLIWLFFLLRRHLGECGLAKP